jgi:hypothetical protein
MGLVRNLDTPSRVAGSHIRETPPPGFVYASFREDEESWSQLLVHSWCTISCK